MSYAEDSLLFSFPPPLPPVSSARGPFTDEGVYIYYINIFYINIYIFLLRFVSARRPRAPPACRGRCIRRCAHARPSPACPPLAPRLLPPAGVAASAVCARATQPGLPRPLRRGSSRLQGSLHRRCAHARPSSGLPAPCAQARLRWSRAREGGREGRMRGSCKLVGIGHG